MHIYLSYGMEDVLNGDRYGEQNKTNKPVISICSNSGVTYFQ